MAALMVDGGSIDDPLIGDKLRGADFLLTGAFDG
jgi:hypothetical protein